MHSLFSQYNKLDNIHCNLCIILIFAVFVDVTLPQKFTQTKIHISSRHHLNINVAVKITFTANTVNHL